MLRPVLLILVLAALVWALTLGPLAGPVQMWLRPLGMWLQAQQRSFQTGLAMDLRALAGGQTAALAGLLGACLAYGFLHAAGPGHGKAVLVAYAAARRASALRVALVGLAAGLAQACVAIVLVLVLAGVAGLSRAGIETLDQGTLAPLALAAMMALGLWLIWRALRRLRPARVVALAPAGAARGPASALLAQAAGGPTAGATVYCTDPDCADCGRPHLPDATALTRATSGWETLGVIAAAAIRPCSGALLLLLLAWQMGMLWVGVLGTLAMGLGTAGVTVSLALAAGLGRMGLMRAASGEAGPRLAAVIEGATGAVLILIAAAVLTTLR